MSATCDTHVCDFNISPTGCAVEWWWSLRRRRLQRQRRRRTNN